MVLSLGDVCPVHHFAGFVGLVGPLFEGCGHALLLYWLLWPGIFVGLDRLEKAPRGGRRMIVLSGELTRVQRAAVIPLRPQMKKFWNGNQSQFDMAQLLGDRIEIKVANVEVRVAM